MFQLRHLLDHHGSEPESATAEPRWPEPESPLSRSPGPETVWPEHWRPGSEPKTIMPEIMTNQEAFLMYGIFMFALTVFCIVLLILVVYLKSRLHTLYEKVRSLQGQMQKSLSSGEKAYVA